MELFAEFRHNKLYGEIISKYLKEKLTPELLDLLIKNKDRKSTKLSCENKTLGKIDLIPFNPFSFEDFILLKDVLQDKYIMKTTTIFNGGIATDEQALENFLLKSVYQPLFDIGMYKIYVKKEFAGCIGSNVIKVKKGKPVEFSIAIYLHRLFQCKGLAFDASKLSLDFLFSKYPQAFIWSTTKIGFRPASRLNKRIGMIHKGQIYKYNKDFMVDYWEHSKNTEGL